MLLHPLCPEGGCRTASPQCPQLEGPSRNCPRTKGFHFKEISAENQSPQGSQLGQGAQECNSRESMEYFKIEYEKSTENLHTRKGKNVG